MAKRNRATANSVHADATVKPTPYNFYKNRLFRKDRIFHNINIVHSTRYRYQTICVTHDAQRTDFVFHTVAPLFDRSAAVYFLGPLCIKLKFHWYQFPCNFPVANVTGKSPTNYEEVTKKVATFRPSRHVQMVWRRR